MHYLPERWCGLRVMIDANAINARQAIAALNQIEAWRSSGAIMHLMAEAAHREARAGNDTIRAAKADRQLIGIAHRGADEDDIRSAIALAIFPNGASSDGENNDVDIVFQARAWGYVLVTMDGGSRTQPRGILGSRRELASLGVSVMSPDEFVRHARVTITEHHSRVRQNCRITGTPFPDWLDQD